jgi:hypothetical protein
VKASHTLVNKLPLDLICYGGKAYMSIGVMKD